MRRGVRGGSHRVVRDRADPNVGFAWLRLIGATIVVIDHSSPLVHPERLTVFPESWQASPGYVALMGFFAMSGYQISDSWARDPSWWRFSARRVLRILPPLLLVLMVTVFVIGPLFTTWSAGAYWREHQTWAYLVLNSVLFPLQHDLPGVFDGNPYPWSPNGSLWTLPMELLGYGLVLVAGLAIAFGLSRLVLFPMLAGMLVLDGIYQATMGNPGRPGALANVPIGSAVSFLVPFVIGMILYTYRDRIPLLPLPALGLFAAWIALNPTPAGRFALPIAAGYGAIVLANRWPKRLEGAHHWVYGSYGMYIWAFPVQQMIIAAGVRDQWVLMALAVPASYLCGLISWRLVEEPTQELRVHLRKPARPAPPRPEPADTTVRLPRIPVEPNPVRGRLSGQLGDGFLRPVR